MSLGSEGKCRLIYFGKNGERRAELSHFCLLCNKCTTVIKHNRDDHREFQQGNKNARLFPKGKSH